MKIGSNTDINKDYKKLPHQGVTLLIPTVRHDNLKMLTERHNDEKVVITLLIVGGGPIAYRFW